MVLVRSEVLGQFVNTITAVYNYIRQNLENLRQQVQTQISLKPKTFSRFFIALMKSTLNLEYFEKKDQFMQCFGSQHVNGSQTLLRSARNHFHTTIPLI